MLRVPRLPEGCRRPRSPRIPHPPPNGCFSDFSQHKFYSSSTTSISQGSNEQVSLQSAEMPNSPLFKFTAHVDEKKSGQHDTCHPSIGTVDDCNEKGKGRRKRRMKLHFDELACPEKPARKVLRRLRIMRYLGLIAPVGSPFSLPHNYS